MVYVYDDSDKYAYDPTDISEGPCFCYDQDPCEKITDASLDFETKDGCFQEVIDYHLPWGLRPSSKYRIEVFIRSEHLKLKLICLVNNRNVKEHKVLSYKIQIRDCEELIFLSGSHHILRRDPYFRDPQECVIAKTYDKQDKRIRLYFIHPSLVIKKVSKKVLPSVSLNDLGFVSHYYYDDSLVIHDCNNNTYLFSSPMDHYNGHSTKYLFSSIFDLTVIQDIYPYQLIQIKDRKSRQIKRIIDLHVDVLVAILYRDGALVIFDFMSGQKFKYAKGIKEARYTGKYEGNMLLTFSFEGEFSYARVKISKKSYGKRFSHDPPVRSKKFDGMSFETNS